GLRQRLERVADGTVLDVLLGGERRVVVARLRFGHLEGRGPKRGLATEYVDGAVVDDRQQPCPRVSAVAAVASGPPPCRQEGVLDDVLGGLGVEPILDILSDRL